MPAVGRTFPTMIDVAKRLDPDGGIADVAELLTQSNPMLADLPMIEGNLPTGHRSTMRVGLPASQFRLMYQGVQPSKSQTTQVTDTCGEILQYSEVDKSIADLNGNTTEFRFSEDRPQIEAMNQRIAQTALYGNTQLNPEQFFGLAGRYGLKSAINGRNIVDAGGTGSDNTSIWMIVPGPNTCHFIYPKGSKAGLETTDKGLETVLDANGGRFEAYRSIYKSQIGMVLRDWRYVVRIANIDVSDLANAGQAAYAGANLIKFLVDGLNAIEDMRFGTPVIYANRTVITALDNIALVKPNLNLGMGEWYGEMVTMFRRCPIRLVDSILNTEARVL
jgi:hypothetical protein